MKGVASSIQKASNPIEPNIIQVSNTARNKLKSSGSTYTKLKFGIGPNSIRPIMIAVGIRKIIFQVNTPN